MHWDGYRVEEEGERRQLLGEVMVACLKWVRWFTFKQVWVSHVCVCGWKTELN